MTTYSKKKRSAHEHHQIDWRIQGVHFSMYLSRETMWYPASISFNCPLKTYLGPRSLLDTGGRYTDQQEPVFTKLVDVHRD